MHDLILWRHGEAGHAHRDLARNLTERGKQQASLTAKWLKEHQVDFPIITSQANRTQQTAASFHEPAIISEQLNPGQAVSSVIEFIQSQAQSQLIVVGHQPWIGQTIAYYLNSQTGYYNLSTSDLWWLRSEDGEQWSVYHHVINSTLG